MSSEPLAPLAVNQGGGVWKEISPLTAFAKYHPLAHFRPHHLKPFTPPILQNQLSLFPPAVTIDSHALAPLPFAKWRLSSPPHSYMIPPHIRSSPLTVTSSSAPLPFTKWRLLSPPHSYTMLPHVTPLSAPLLSLSHPLLLHINSPPPHGTLVAPVPAIINPFR